MAASRTRIGSLQFEEESTFASTTEVHGLDNNEYLRIYDVTISPSQEPLEDDTLRDTLYKLTKLGGSKRGSTFSFKMRLADENAVTATANFAIVRLLKSAWGATHLDTKGNATVTGGADTTHFTVADADAPSIGQAVVIKDATAAGPKEMRWVTNVTSGGGTSTCTVNQAFSFTPANTDQLYVGHTVYPTSAVEGGPASLYFKFIGEGLNEQWQFYGCRADSVALSMADGFIDIEFSFKVTDWVRTNIAAGSVVADVWQFGRPIPYLHHAFYIDATKTDILPNWSMNLGMVLEDLETPEGQGRAEFEWSDREIVGSFSPRWSSNHFDRFPSSTMSLMLIGQEGASTGVQHWGMLIPAAHLVDTPAREENAGQSHLTLNWRAGQYTSDTGSTAPADTDARISIITSA